MGGGNIMGKLSLAFFAFGKARPTAYLFTTPYLVLTWGAVFTLNKEGGCGNCCFWVISSGFLPLHSRQRGFFFCGQMKCLFVLKVTSVLCEFWILSNAKPQLAGFEFHRLSTDT